MEESQNWDIIGNEQMNQLAKKISLIEGQLDQLNLKVDKLLELSSIEGRSRTYNHVWRSFPSYLNPTLHYRLQDSMSQNNSESNLKTSNEEQD